MYVRMPTIDGLLCCCVQVHKQCTCIVASGVNHDCVSVYVTYEVRVYVHETVLPTVSTPLQQAYIHKKYETRQDTTVLC